MVHRLFPITFSIPECKRIRERPVVDRKTKLLSDLIPGRPETYIYDTEDKYRAEYQSSYCATTMKKGGWDCFRHYEIVANGCLPYFHRIENCPARTLALWDKTLFVEANRLYENWNDTETDKNEWQRLMTRFMDHFSLHLTTRCVADYVLQSVGFAEGRVLFLSGNVHPDYLRCLTLHGLKERLGSRCHDYPRIGHLYHDYGFSNDALYGRGMNYSKLLDPALHDYSLDATVEKDIHNKVYDLVIYSSLHRGTPFYEKVVSVYEPHKIVFLCGDDNSDDTYQHDPACYQPLTDKGHFVFVRELS